AGGDRAPRRRMDAGQGQPAVRHPGPRGLRPVLRRPVARRRRSRVLDRGGPLLGAGDRRRGVRPRRGRTGARRRRVRHAGRSGDCARHLRRRAALMEAEIVQRFLESVGAKADIDLYLKLFRAQRKESFAILAPNAQIVKSALDPVHFDLRILAGLGLMPVVLLGMLEPKDADAQASRVSDWLLEDAVPCEPIGAGTDEQAIREGTAAAVRATMSRGAIPLVSLEASKEMTVEGRFRLLAALSTELETRKILFLSRRAGLVLGAQPA